MVARSFAGGERALREAMSVLPDDERSATASARQMGKLQAAEIGTTARRLEILRGSSRAAHVTASKQGR